MVPPPTTMLGGLYRFLRDSKPKHFQPMNSNWGLVDPLEGKRIRDKGEKRCRLADRALDEFLGWMAEVGVEPAVDPDSLPRPEVRKPRRRGGRSPSDTKPADPAATPTATG